METKNEIIQKVQRYQEQFTAEVQRTAAILTFLHNFDGDQLFYRKNFTGHITASAYIINPQKDAILLLKHKALNRWLQPGGHVDLTDKTLLDAALREAEEETGIPAKKLELLHSDIFEVDSHIIPANDIKQEPEHIHHDIGFLFTCKILEIDIDEQESTAGKWVSFSELSADVDYEDVIKKITILTSH